MKELRDGNIITYTKTYGSGESDTFTAKVVNRININWTDKAILDNGDEIRIHHASPPNLANDPYSQLKITNYENNDT